MTGCTLCGRVLKRPLSLGGIFSFHTLQEPLACEICQSAFERIDQKQACAGCGRLQEDRTFCSDCERWQEKNPHLPLKHQSLFTYNEAAQAFMHQYKFQGDVKLAVVFSEVLKDVLKPYRKTHLLTTIPTRPTSLQTRGFRAVDLLLDYATIPYQPLLEVARETGMQSTKTRGERLSSRQPFHLKNEEPLRVLDKKILIIDDVYTTGRTILHARELLESYGTTESLSLFR